MGCACPADARGVSYRAPWRAGAFAGHEVAMVGRVRGARSPGWCGWRLGGGARRVMGALLLAGVAGVAACAPAASPGAAPNAAAGAGAASGDDADHGAGRDAAAAGHAARPGASGGEVADS